MGFLSEKNADLRRALEREPLDESALMSRVALMPAPRGFSAALRGEAVAVIAEMKRASPSAGAIAEADPSKRSALYEAGGASAISVLTESRHFGGSLSDLRAVHDATTVPVLRKDFLIHPAQLMEARAGGADAVLLICASLTETELKGMLAAAQDLGLGALVEVHSEEDLIKVLTTDAEVVGVNSRDLESLEVDEDRAIRLLESLPVDRVGVFESGISTREQVERAGSAGAQAVLVGAALMKSKDPAATIRELLGGEL